MQSTTTTTTTFTCHECGKVGQIQTSGASGYGLDKDGKTFCYECCAEHTRELMVKDGRACLYLSGDGKEVTDWPGVLRFPVKRLYRSEHNIAKERLDFWFRGPDAKLWHGVGFYGFSGLARCKRNKKG